MPSARPGKLPAASDTIMAVAEPAAMSGPSSSTSCTRSASVLSDPSTASDGKGRADLGDVPEEEADGGRDLIRNVNLTSTRLFRGQVKLFATGQISEKISKCTLRKLRNH